MKTDEEDLLAVKRQALADYATHCSPMKVRTLKHAGLDIIEGKRARPFRVPFGVVIPVVVALVYGALFFLVFLPDPAHPEDWITKRQPLAWRPPRL